jgi:hypothetical protein
MTRGGGALIVIAISWFFVVSSLWRLWHHRLRREFFVALGVLSALAALLYIGLSWSWTLETGDQRAWAVAPFIFLLILYLFSGFFLRSYVEARLEPPGQSVASSRRRPSTAHRIAGGGLAALGVGVWVYGLARPITGTAYIWVLIFALASMLFGVAYLFTGKKIGDIDS